MNTEKACTFGTMNGHSVGIIMKELVRRAIANIRNQRQVFEVTAKMGHRGKMDDMFTTADTAAQRVYIKSLQECFPGFGLIAEEKALNIICTDGSGMFFTVDPLDGTKAFVRKQSHGVGTMISLSCGQEFLAAFVGDVSTHEIYGFRPGSPKTHRISEFNIAEELVWKVKPLKHQYVLLRDPAQMYSPLSQKFIRNGFKNHLVDGGSIGVWMARLWKGEVGAVIVNPSMETPWDSNPINAITEHLGFTFWRPSKNGKKWIPYLPAPIASKWKRNFDVLIIHKSNTSEIP